jgi:hypothetical protein
MTYRYVIKYMDGRNMNCDHFEYDGDIKDCYNHRYPEDKSCLATMIDGKYCWIPLHDIRIIFLEQVNSFL